MSETPHELDYEHIAAITDDEAAQNAIKALLDDVRNLTEQNAALIANAETVATQVNDLHMSNEMLNDSAIKITDELKAVKAERDELRAYKSKEQERTKAAGQKNAEIAGERDAATALLETALKAQKRAENALSNAQSQNSASDATIHSIGTELNEAVLERDTLRSKNSELHKQVERLTEAKRNQDRAIQTFVGAASKPVSGPCELVIRSKPVNGLGEVTFDIPAGHTLFNADVVDGNHWVRTTRATVAVEPVPDDVPEQGETTTEEAVPRAA